MREEVPHSACFQLLVVNLSDSNSPSSTHTKVKRMTGPEEWSAGFNNSGCGRAEERQHIWVEEGIKRSIKDKRGNMQKGEETVGYKFHVGRLLWKGHMDIYHTQVTGYVSNVSIARKRHL